jgi:hypothetical protein
MTLASDQIIMPITEDARRAGLRREFDIQQANRKPDQDIEEHYKGLGQVGQWLLNIYNGQNAERMKAFENRDFVEFFHSYWRWVREACAENGWKPSEVKLSQDSGITNKGDILLRLEKIEEGAK